MTIHPRLLSDEHLGELRRQYTGHSIVTDLLGHIAALELAIPKSPIPMRLVCPECVELHVDEHDFAIKPHHTHACQKCGNVWRPAVVSTVGVRFLPGFKNGGDL